MMTTMMMESDLRVAVVEGEVNIEPDLDVAV